MAEIPGNKKKFDVNSIRTTTLFSFVLFALLLVFVLWCLSNFFISTYFEKARSQEVLPTAEALKTQYRQDRENFETYAVQTAGSNGIYIRIASKNEVLEYDGTRSVRDTGMFSSDIDRVLVKLADSQNESVTETIVEGSSPRLVYASYISSPTEPSIIYIIAPLHPDEVTIRILKDLLIYISIILLALSFLLAYALSGRITDPIEHLTEAATELSQGKYDVTFDGSQFTETKELARALSKASYEMEKTDFYQKEIIDISGDDKDKRNADLQIIISETERLNRLVSDMLSVSNLQSNNVELHMETFDLTEAARDVYESFRVLQDSEGFEIQFHPCKPTYVVGDRSRLTQVMNNFVSNAVKYSGDNKFVDIRLVKASRKITFHCIDHGMGIPSDEISHVWDKYYRTSANHRRGIEGTGLGLSIVKGILSLHNAKYGVESEEGKGSDFWFEMETVRKPAAKKNKDTEVTNGKES